MSSTGTAPTSTTHIDSPAVYEPAVGSGTALITGSVTGSAAIANLELYDNGTPIGGIAGFQSSSSRWQLIADLAPGKHVITSVTTEVTGAQYNVIAPFVLVTGIQNQPYVYQELDENAQGVVTRISDYDGAGTLVSQTAVAVNGSAAAPLKIAFDPTSTYVGPTEALLTGTTSAYGSASSVEVFDGPAGSTIDPATGKVSPTAVPLGYATVGTDGTWSLDAHVSPGHHVFTAVATSFDGTTASAQSSFAIDAGAVGSPYVFQEIDHNAAGAVAATTSYAADGTVVGRSVGGGATVNGGTSSGQVIRSAYDDVMTGDGTGSNTFLFRRGFGQDEITNFNYLSAADSPAHVEHDVVSLPQSAFTKVAQVLRHTTSALDGSAVIHLSRTDSIKLDGVTKADLVTHPNVFRFHN